MCLWKTLAQLKYITNINEIQLDSLVLKINKTNLVDKKVVNKKDKLKQVRNYIFIICVVAQIDEIEILNDLILQLWLHNFKQLFAFFN